MTRLHSREIHAGTVPDTQSRVRERKIVFRDPKNTINQVEMAELWPARFAGQLAAQTREQNLNRESLWGGRVLCYVYPTLESGQC